MIAAALHPSHILQEAQAATSALPVCDHYCGTEVRMRKALCLQSQLQQEFGANVLDVTLDCEDGAASGREVEHAHLITKLLLEAPTDARLRRAVRLHPVDHPAFASDVAIIVGQCAHLLSHLMIPKVETVADITRAAHVIDHATRRGSQLGYFPCAAAPLPLHVLLESPAAIHRAFDIAAHTRVQSISFGLMDFVSAHAGAIAESAMQMPGQFEHPLIMRAKLEIAAACHAWGKTPSHCVVTEYRDHAAISQAAHRACHELGYTRMWSIHPDQIRPILAAFTPEAAAVDKAAAILVAAAAAQWAPISHEGQLHDRASYRYYWHVLQRAHHTGAAIPEAVAHWFTHSKSSPSGQNPEDNKSRFSPRL